jgi:t-SNARE complex subunit (syntaxin)
MQIEHGILHGLKHLGLYSHHFLKSRRKGWRRIGIIVVVLLIVLNIVVGSTIPCVDHLKYER